MQFPVLRQINHFDEVEAKFRDVSIHKVRVAETAPDFTSAINAGGKFVTHGIEFDADSDHLTPESAPVLKEIAAALAKDPQLKLEIDAYTDPIGDAAHSLELSKLRAQAVQSVLVTQFGIAGNAIRQNGFGPAKPTWIEWTPEGRAENRRMEFVKNDAEFALPMALWCAQHSLSSQVFASEINQC